MFTSTIRFKAAVAATAAVALLAAGCSSNGSTSSPVSGTSTSPGMSGSMPGMDHGSSASPSAAAAARTDYNDADVTFVQMMYPHHAQAVDMAQLVPGRSQNQQVIALAANIEKAQAPEMEQRLAFLQPVLDVGDHVAHAGIRVITGEQVVDLGDGVWRRSPGCWPSWLWRSCDGPPDR
jgi:uncharacterized protein (DUF305 family)